MAQELTPPATLTPPVALTPPEPVQVVPQSQADGMIKLSDQEAAKLDTRVNEFINAILTLDAHMSPSKTKSTRFTLWATRKSAQRQEPRTASWIVRSKR